MRQYSQHHLKVAATEPEHILRKAEFDATVELIHEEIEKLSGRIEHGGPAVLSPDFPLEVIEANDTTESPATKPVNETAVILDGTETRFPVSRLGLFSSESTRFDDTIESPEITPTGEAAGLSTEAGGVTPLSYTQNHNETIAASDTVTPQLNGERIMEQQQMQGEIEVIVEDRSGGVKSRQKISNAITDAFLRYSLYDMVNGGTLSSVLRSNIRTNYNLISRTVPSTLGIYAMDRSIDVREDTFLPPYACGDLNTLDGGVTFYNVGGNPTEDSQVMIPVDQRCYFDHNRREMVVEYVKNTGSGIVKSVCVGRSHLLKKEMYSAVQTETAVPNPWLASGTYYLVEHHPTNGTSIWKQASTSTQYRFNLKARTMETFSSSNLYNNIITATTTSGLVVGEHLFKAQKQAASGSTHTVRLYYVANFKTSATSVYKDITLTAKDGMTASTDTMPVMVYRTDTGNLEIFVAVSCGNHDGVYGHNIQKVTVSSLENPATMTTATTDLGVIPYGVSNFNTTSALYMTGYFDGTNYYLPYTQTIDSTGKIDVISENAFQNGIVISPDFKTVSRVFNMRNSVSGPNLVVRVDTGFLQCQANASNIPYIFMSQVVSGANLPEPSVKGLDDVLRIIYRYRLS